MESYKCICIKDFLPCKSGEFYEYITRKSTSGFSGTYYEIIDSPLDIFLENQFKEHFQTMPEYRNDKIEGLLK